VWSVALGPAPDAHRLHPNYGRSGLQQLAYQGDQVLRETKCCWRLSVAGVIGGGSTWQQQTG
jgi:hypothetical protein